MITCKEDLMNTYVKNTPELRRGFLSLAVKFGLIDSKSKVCESSEDAMVAYWQNVTGDNPTVGCWLAYAYQIKEECRELTISDLESTPTKFVKVEESIFDLKGEFERGELFTKKAWGEYVLIKEDTHLASLYEMQSHENSKIGIYRQVEIDWRDEVKKLNKSAIFHDDGDLFLVIDSNSSDFISMCHEIASLTEKPTN